MLSNVRAALESAVAAMTPAMQTAWDNVQFNSTVGTPYQVITVLYSDPINQEFGSNFQEIGYMQISLCYPISSGSALLEARADLVRTTFKRGNSFASGGVIVTVSATPSIRPGYVDGDFYVKPIIINFYSNIGL